MRDFEFRDEKITYRDGYKYQLASDCLVRIAVLKPYIGATSTFATIVEGGILIIHSGYAWDGPSGPTYDSKETMRASLVHDVLYQMMRLGLIPESFRDTADRLFKDIALADGMNSIRAWFWYEGLEWFGSKNAKRGTEREVIIAP